VSQPFQFKRGSTFSVTVYYTPGTGDPSDLSATTVTSSVVTNGVEYSGSVNKAGDNKSFTVSITSATTATWPLAPAEWDVKFVYSGTTFYSATQNLQIVDNITT